MLYDLTTGAEESLGPGGEGSFSPDSRQLVWIRGEPGGSAPTDVMVMDVQSHATHDLGPGTAAKFTDNEHVLLLSAGGETSLVDLASGARKSGVAPDFGTPQQQTGDGYSVEVTRDSPESGMARVRDASGVVRYEFAASAAHTVGYGELVVATPVRAGNTNIFIVNLRSGSASFVSSVNDAGGDWPLSATPDYVLWTENYCRRDGTQAHTILFDRRTHEFTELTSPEAPFWLTLLSSSTIAVGEMPEALLVPGSWTYGDVFPTAVALSPDLKYASAGATLGHGGPCV